MMMHITYNHVQQGFQGLLAVLLGILNVGDVLAKTYDKCFMVTQNPVTSCLMHRSCVKQRPSKIITSF